MEIRKPVLNGRVPGTDTGLMLTRPFVLPPHLGVSGILVGGSESASVDDQVSSIDFRNLSLYLTEKVGLARG